MVTDFTDQGLLNTVKKIEDPVARFRVLIGLAKLVKEYGEDFEKETGIKLGGKDVKKEIVECEDSEHNRRILQGILDGTILDVSFSEKPVPKLGVKRKNNKGEPKEGSEDPNWWKTGKADFEKQW